MVQALVADSVIDIEASRGADPHAAPRCSTPAAAERTSPRSPRSSSSEAVGRVVDRAMQICGGLGASDDLPLGALCTRGARVPDLRRAERDAPLVDRAARRAPPPARAVNGPVDVVDTPARGGRAAAARRSSCGARSRPGSTSSGLGRGPLAVDAHRRRPLERDVPARARRRAHGAAPAAAPAAAALGPRHAARGARAERARRAAPACRACSPCARTPDVLGVPFYVMEELDGDVVTDALPAVARHAPRRAARAGRRPRRRARRAARGRHRERGAERLRAPRRLPRAPAAALRRALGAQRDARPAARRRARRLARRAPCPRSGEACVVHGDYRLGNVMLDRASRRACWRCSTGSSRRSAIRSPTSATSSRPTPTRPRRRPSSTSRR